MEAIENSIKIQSRHFKVSIRLLSHRKHSLVCFIFCLWKVDWLEQRWNGTIQTEMLVMFLCKAPREELEEAYTQKIFFLGSLSSFEQTYKWRKNNKEAENIDLKDLLSFARSFEGAHKQLVIQYFIPFPLLGLWCLMNKSLTGSIIGLNVLWINRLCFIALRLSNFFKQ